MSLFTIAIIVYVVLMVILEIIQSGRKRKFSPTKEPLKKTPLREEFFYPTKEEKETKKPPTEKEEILPKGEGEGITLEYTKEKLEESREGVSLEYKEEEKIEKIKELRKRKKKKEILSFYAKDEILKLIIFKEIITPHPLTRRFLKRKI